MGNWRTVEVIGQVDKNEVVKMKEFIKANWDREDDDFFYLQAGEGLYGLNDWVQDNGRINRSGNVYERDCKIEDLKRELEILAEKFKTLDMKLHAGDDYEATNCVATFVVKNGVVSQIEPEVQKVAGVSMNNVMANFMKAMER